MYFLKKVDEKSAEWEIAQKLVEQRLAKMWCQDFSSL